MRPDGTDTVRLMRITLAPRGVEDNWSIGGVRRSPLGFRQEATEMSALIDTTEMYLRTIYELLEEGISPRRARIVERLHQTGPTVSQTVARMERDGLLT